VIWIQLRCDVAVHAHPVVVLTDTEPVPPLALKDLEVGEME
jgi:hypothetical protein